METLNATGRYRRGGVALRKPEATGESGLQCPSSFTYPGMMTMPLGRPKGPKRKVRVNRNPLRRVVDREARPGGLILEVLECGHKVRERLDVIGPTNAVRRRCAACARSVD